MAYLPRIGRLSSSTLEDSNIPDLAKYTWVLIRNLVLIASVRSIYVVIIDLAAFTDNYPNLDTLN